MRWRRLTVLGASLLLAVSGNVRAQSSGNLDSRTNYAVITGPGSNGQHGPLLAIVLWRGEPGWNESRSPVERARIDSIFRWARLHAEENRQSFFGSGLAYGLVDQDQRAITIEGTRFALSPGDSALVIMVNVGPDNLPRSVASVAIASTLPVDFWTKSWQSGDTTFFVNNFRRQQAILRDVLEGSPTVAAFLR
jgi:hypothetical protein